MPAVARFTFFFSLVAPVVVSCCTISLLDHLDSNNAQTIFVATALGIALLSPLYSAVYCAFRLDRPNAARIGFGFVFALGFYAVQWAVFYAGCTAAGGYL